METSLFLVFVILCGCSINASASATQIQSFNTNETNLTDLEQMDFRGLVNAANISEEFSLAAADVFRRKFANRSIIIKQDDENYVGVVDDYIFLKSYDVTVLVLEHFGSHILNLEIDYHVLDQKARLKQIITLLNQKCSNLTKLNIHSDNWDTLEDVQRIFHTVKDLAFDGRYNKLGSETLNLNEMFPNVRSLLFDGVELKDYDSVNITLPNLRNFKLGFAQPELSERAEFKNFIQKNPQLKEFTLDYTNTSYIKFVSEHLVNLDVLTLDTIRYVDYTDEIHFKNVKRFSVMGYIDIGHLENITFDDLEAFHCDQREFPIWLDFIKPHRNLSELRLARASKISDNDLILLSERVPNLVEATISCGYDVDVETLIRFLEESKHLKQLKLFIYGFPERSGNMDALKSRIEDKWTLNEGDAYYEIERKN